MDLVRYARSLRLLGGSLLGVAFPVVDADRAGRVANDIQAGTAHVEQTVDAVDEADVELTTEFTKIYEKLTKKDVE